MNVRRIAASAALALALVAATSPAWSADGNRTAGGNAGVARAGGSSGIASYLAREFARNPQPVTRALASPQAAYSWSHDSRIPTWVTPATGTSWSHDSRIPTWVTPATGTSWSHDSRIPTWVTRANAPR